MTGTHPSGRLAAPGPQTPGGVTPTMVNEAPVTEICLSMMSARRPNRRVQNPSLTTATGGAPSERLSAIGHGEDQPLQDNATEAGRAENRRVEFRLKDCVSADVDAPSAASP